VIVNKYEALSALIDGEWENIVGLLKQVSADPELRSRWEEHFRTRAVLHGDYTYLPRHDFAAQVREAIGNEPAILAPRIANSISNLQSSRWHKPVLGFAIAATVAAVSVLGLNNFSPAINSIAPPVARTAPGEIDNIIAKTRVAALDTSVREVSHSPDGMHWQLQRVEKHRDAAVERQLNRYLLDHLEYSTSGRMRGMMQYSGLIGYDTSE